MVFRGRYGVEVARWVLALLPRARYPPEDEREGRDAGPRCFTERRSAARRLTQAMVAFHKRYHHRKPVSAKTLMLGDDLLACVLGGVYTDVEKTMIEIQRKTIVQETRNELQNAMQANFIEAVERLTGRGVVGFISIHHVGPDIEIELFLLTPDGTSDDRRVAVVPEPDLE